MKLQDLKYTIGGLVLAIDSFYYNDYIYFWRHTEPGNEVTQACLSQWYPCHFIVDGIAYNCAEQYMMAEKARLFGDHQTCSKIMQATDPEIIKHLGRKVRNFDADLWNEHCIDIVLKGNLHKFGQNQPLKNYLLSTGRATFVEASPYDKVWGIGVGEREARKTIPHFWKGENRLGFILMEVREILRNNDSINS